MEEVTKDWEEVKKIASSAFNQSVQISLHAAYFAEAVREVEGFSEWRYMHEMGHIEFMTDLVKYAPVMLDAEQSAAKVVDFNYPGVFEYEVSAYFGEWFAKETMRLGGTPQSADVLARIKSEVVGFFAQGEGAPVRSELEAAIVLK